MQRVLCGATILVFASVLVSCGGGGRDEPNLAAPPTTITSAVAPTSATTAVVRTRVPGFDTVSIRVSSGPELCALLAKTAAQRSKGLSGRTDLAGYVGMLFVYAADSTLPYQMKDTPMPLSIAWFDGSGHFVSSKDMTPCLDRPACPGYAAAGPYRAALEVPQGGLAGLGIGSGTVLTLGGPC